MPLLGPTGGEQRLICLEPATELQRTAFARSSAGSRRCLQRVWITDRRVVGRDLRDDRQGDVYVWRSASRVTPAVHDLVMSRSPPCAACGTTGSRPARPPHVGDRDRERAYARSAAATPDRGSGRGCPLGGAVVHEVTWRMPAAPDGLCRHAWRAELRRRERRTGDGERECSTRCRRHRSCGSKHSPLLMRHMATMRQFVVSYQRQTRLAQAPDARRETPAGRVAVLVVSFRLATRNQQLRPRPTGARRPRPASGVSRLQLQLARAT